MGWCGAVSFCLAGTYATLFLITGVALILYGLLSTYLLLLVNTEQVIKEYMTLLPSAVMVVFGVILFLIVTLGCCGICKESSRFLETYAALLLLLGLTQLVFGGYCVATYGNQDIRRDLDARIGEDIRNAVINYKEDPGKMDTIQSWIKCCGYKDAVQDYIPEPPPSCCPQSESICSYDSDNFYKGGCFKKVSDFTLSTNYVMGCTSFAVGIMELIAGLLGLCLSCCIWRK